MTEVNARRPSFALPVVAPAGTASTFGGGTGVPFAGGTSPTVQSRVSGGFDPESAAQSASVASRVSVAASVASGVIVGANGTPGAPVWNLTAGASVASAVSTRPVAMARPPNPLTNHILPGAGYEYLNPPSMADIRDLAMDARIKGLTARRPAPPPVAEFSPWQQRVIGAAAGIHSAVAGAGVAMSGFARGIGVGTPLVMAADHVATGYNRESISAELDTNLSQVQGNIGTLSGQSKLRWLAHRVMYRTTGNRAFDDETNLQTAVDARDYLLRDQADVGGRATERGLRRQGNELSLRIRSLKTRDPFMQRYYGSLSEYDATVNPIVDQIRSTQDQLNAAIKNNDVPQVIALTRQAAALASAAPGVIAGARGVMNETQARIQEDRGLFQQQSGYAVAGIRAGIRGDTLEAAAARIRASFNPTYENGRITSISYQGGRFNRGQFGFEEATDAFNQEMLAAGMESRGRSTLGRSQNAATRLRARGMGYEAQQELLTGRRAALKASGVAADSESGKIQYGEIEADEKMLAFQNRMAMASLSVSLGYRADTLEARRMRDPTGAAMAGVKQGYISQALGIFGSDSLTSDQKRSALGTLTGQAREEFGLAQRDYGMQFRGTQFDLKNMLISNPRDQENPVQVMKSIEKKLDETIQTIKNLV